MDDQDKSSVNCFFCKLYNLQVEHNMESNNYLLAGYVNIFEYNKLGRHVLTYLVK